MRRVFNQKKTASNIANRWEFSVKSYLDVGFILLCLLCNIVFDWLLQLLYVQKVLVQCSLWLSYVIYIFFF